MYLFRFLSINFCRDKMYIFGNHFICICCRIQLRPLLRPQRDRTYPLFVYRDLAERIISFRCRPWNRRLKAQPVPLALAGFYYWGPGDKVRCATCLGTLKNWRLNDDPLYEHYRHYPRCSVVTCFVVMRHLVTLGIQKRTRSQGYLPSCMLISTRRREIIMNRLEQDRVMEEAGVIIEETNQTLLCKICLATRIQVLVFPCKHLVLCKQCSGRIKDCPMCRIRIVATTTVFLA